MKISLTLVMLLTAMAYAANLAAAQESRPMAPDQPAAKGAAAKPAVHPAATLPEPLAHVTTNIMDLEKDGYFVVGPPQFSTIGGGRYDAIVWEVRAARPVTYRHVLMMLDRLRDARFVRTARDRTQEVHATLLYYSPRIEPRADNRMLLEEDDLFEVWVYLNTEETRKIESLKADTLQLRPKRD